MPFLKGGRLVKSCFWGFFLVLSVVLCLPQLSAQSQLVNANQIMITNHGIMVNINGQGQIFQTETVTYVGNGIYEIDVNYYGTCRRCGWPRDERGCTNQICDGYGPKRDRD